MKAFYFHHSYPHALLKLLEIFPALRGSLLYIDFNSAIAYGSAYRIFMLCGCKVSVVGVGVGMGVAYSAGYIVFFPAKRDGPASNIIYSVV